jgi:ParB family chromosome partitioning protein
MSSKKSFTIPKDLTSGIRSSIESASTNLGQLNYHMMALDKIEPDPKNPRKLLITIIDIQKGLNQSDPNYETKLKEYELLSDLAESIKKVGVRNAIEVLKMDSKYRIISGERRFLASILAGQEYIPARVNEKFDELKLRYIQWVENINRQDLSLLEKYNNLISMEQAYFQVNKSKFNIQALQEILGVSKTQAYRYLSLLNANAEIIDLIKGGKLVNLKVIEELVNIKSSANQKQAIQAISTTDTDSTSHSSFQVQKKDIPPTQKPINLGKIKNRGVAQFVLKIILNEPNIRKHKDKFIAVDWNSTKEINKVFKSLMKLLENELSEKETADEI